MIFIGIFFNAILFIALIWMYFLIFKVMTNKEFAKTPPFVPSFGKEYKIIESEVSKILESSNNLKIVDPGCGTGSLIIKLAKKFPNHRFVGVEWSLPVYKICKWRCRNIKNITILKDNLFNYPFDDTDIIVCFLMQPLMEDVGNKIIKECKKVVVFSNSFYIPNLKLTQEFKTTKKGFIENVYEYNLGL